MTPAQLNLLKELKASNDRGAASLSCLRRLSEAHALEDFGYAAWHGNSLGDSFYYITPKGLKKLERLT